jgi:FkbM family methyltransferase
MIKSTKTRYSDNFSYYDTDEIIGRSLDLYGEYSQFELEFLLAMLNKNSVVYDIGANIGYHTTAFASVAKKVYAFEPHPKTYELLEKNTKGLDHVYIGKYAVSNKNATCCITDYDPETTGNFGAVSVVNDYDSVEATAISLDTAELDLPDLIKIDVEGHELQVLQGCEKIIQQKCPVIFYEAHESDQLREIYEFLEPLGYRLYWAQINNYNPDNFAGHTENVFGTSGLMSIVAWPKTLTELPLMPVAGPGDNDVSKFYTKEMKSDEF